MSRPARNRLLAAIFVALVVLVAPRLPNVVAWLAFALVAVVIAASLWVTRGFRQARALLAQKKYDDAALELAAFERSLSERWRKRLAGLSVGLYTNDAVAAARNTLGAVRLEQGRLEDAATHFDAALALDAQYAVPWANRAVLAALRGDRAAANEAKQRAKALGFGSKTLDAVVSDKLGSK